MDYFVLTAITDEEGGAVIESLPDGCPADWRFDEGKTLAQEFSSGTVLKFSSNYPDNKKLFDFVRNILGLLVVSGRTQRIIAQFGVENAEFLPVKINDHRGNVVGDDYAILNLLGSEDAIDMNKSEYRMNRIQKDQISRIKKLVLNRGGIHPDAIIFRASMYRRLFLMREDLREAFFANNLSGFKTFPADGWNGIKL